MDFIERIQEISARIPKQIDHIKTEEATKNAFVMPFIAALGYDIFNPMEVVPELIADFGIKKGEKVDYAIMVDSKPIILFEVKWVGADLDLVHASQLSRYFTFTDANISVLTNGVEYRFFSDLEKKNRMDSRPFFIFNMLDYRPAQVEELKKFSKPKFDIDGILATASELKYTREIQKLMASEWTNPSDEFVRLFAKQVYIGVLHQAAKERFTVFTKKAAAQFLNDLINERLQTAITQDSPKTEDFEDEGESENEPDPRRKIVTTQDELEGYVIVKTILREVIESDRVAMRDTLSYCGVLYDDNNRKPICRLRFNTQQRYIGLIDENKTETKHPINRLQDIYQHADSLKAIALFYDQES